MTVLQYINRPAPLAAPPAVALLGNEPSGAGLHFAADQHFVVDPGNPANSKLATTDDLIADGTIVYSANSPRTNWGRLGKLETVAANVPRLSYDPLSVVTSTATLQFRRGVRAITVTAGYTFAAGTFIALTDTGTPARWMRGRVVSHVGTLLVVDIYWVAPGVTGSSSAWTIIRSLGYLPEPTRTNLLPYSSMSGAGWAVANATRGSSPIMDPWGGYNATLITATAASFARAQLSGGITMTAATAYSLALLVYAGSATALHGTVELSGTETMRFFGRFSDGAASASVTSGTIAFASPKMVSVGSGWWLYTIAVTPGVTGAHSVFAGPASTYGTATATIGDTIHFSDAQIEVGAYPTSYIPTTTASVSRSADFLTCDLTKLPFNATEFTVLGEALPCPDVTSTGFLVASVYKNSSEHSTIRNGQAGMSRLQLVNRTGNVDTGAVSPAGAVAASRFKFAGAFKASDYGLAANGASLGTYSSGALASGYTNLAVGASSNSAGQWSAPIASLVLIPRRLSQAEMAARTPL